MADEWLVTGGCGFVGSNLAASLLEDGIDVVVLDTLVRVGASENLAWLEEKARRPGAGRLVHLRADTRSRTDVDDAFARHAAGVTVVAHLAGQVAMTTSLERPRYDFEVNALGALNVLEAVRERCPRAVAMFSSTNKVYGDLAGVRHVEAPTRWTLPDHPRGLDEAVPLDFRSPYGCSKGAADQYFLDYHRMYGLTTIVFRHSSIYGGRQFATYDQGWVGWFCGEVLRQKREAAAGAAPRPFTVSGDGKQVRDLLHADDLVSCYRMAARAADRCAGQPFNIGGGMENSLSLVELFEELARLTGQRATFERLPSRASDQRVFVADCAKARATFGWAPAVSKAAGLERMLEWVRSSGTAAR
jgi:CDP-paratose 2-epimerase